MEVKLVRGAFIEYVIQILTCPDTMYKKAVRGENHASESVLAHDHLHIDQRVDDTLMSVNTQ